MKRQKKQKKLTLSISLLASNRKETTRKCLESLKPLMVAIPSELIIVDTGCDEQMHQMLEEYATEIIKFEWCNDFSKARNAGLKQASGEWFLFIDDDEWFEDVSDIIKFFKSGNYRKHGYANYIQRNYLDADGQHYTDTWVSRMVRLDKEIQFKSKIHEYMEPVRGKCAGINSYVHHYGYVYADEEAKMNHFRRNERLLQEMKIEEPENMRWWVQIAQEYRSVSWHQELLDFAKEALEKFKNRNEYYDNMNIGTFYVSMIDSLVGLDRQEEALEACAATLNDGRNTALCRAHAYLAAGDICLKLGRYEESEKHIQEYLRLYKYLQKEQGMLFVQKSALLVNEALDFLKVKKAYSILICSGLKQNNTRHLKKYLKEMDWKGKNVFLLDGMFEIVIEAMSKMPEEDILVETVNVVSNHPALWERLLIDLKAWELTKKPAFENVIKVLAKAEANNEYLRGMQIRNAILEGDQEALNSKYDQLLKTIANVFDLSDDLWKIALQHQVPLEEYYLKVPFLTWKVHLRDYMAKTTEKRLQELKQRMQSIRTLESRKYEYFDMRVSEAEILFRKKWNNLAECRNQLQEFAERTVRFNGYYYKTEVMEQFPELLPESCQAALWLKKAVGEEDISWDVTKKCLKQCAAVYHGLADAVKEYIRLFGEEQLAQERKAREAKEELRRLTLQLKEKIRELLQKGMAAEAGMVVDQLKVLLPHDLEVVTLSLQVKLLMLHV